MLPNTVADRTGVNGDGVRWNFERDTGHRAEDVASFRGLEPTGK